MRVQIASFLLALAMVSNVASAQEAEVPTPEAEAPAPEPAVAEEAATPTDVVVLAYGSGDVTEEALSQTRSAVVSTVAIERARHERVVRPERDPGLADQASSCGDDACYAALGRDAEAGYLFVIGVEREAGAHRASVLLVDVAAGRTVGSAAVDLPGDPAGFVDAMRAPMGPLLAAITPIGPTTGAVVLTVDQDGAAVFLDGERVGTAPMPPGEIEAGEHELRVTLEGFEDFEQTVTVVRGEELRFEVTLEPLQEEVPVGPVVTETPLWRRWWFWAIVGGVVAGVALGVGLGVGLSDTSGPEPEWGVPFPTFGER